VGAGGLTERSLPHAKAKLAARQAVSPNAAWAAEIKRAVLASCHPKQRAFVEDPSRRVAARVGRGGGKSTGWMARAIIKATAGKAKVLFIATTRQQAEDLIWAKLKDTLEKLRIEATFNETKLRCTIRKTDATIRLVGADDKREVDKLRGQTFDEVGIDEAASHGASLLDALIFRILGPRLGDGAAIVLFGTPGHNLAGEFYEATRPNGPKNKPWSDREPLDGWGGWSMHQWTLEDGGLVVPEMARLWREALVEKETNQWVDDHPIWMREYLGQWAADDTENVYKYKPHDAEGQPWNQWDPERVGPMRFAKLPDRADWLYVLALDMGHGDPFACNVFTFSPSDPGKGIYHVFGFERTGMYARTIAELLLGEQVNTERPGGVIGQMGWPIGAIADADEAFIAEMGNVYGVRLTKAERKMGYKFGAIELVNGDLIDGRIKILKGSSLEQQCQQLQWVANEYGELKENKAQPNHCFAAGTMVMTEHGERPIESIAVGELVWTRSGLRRVTFSGRTGERPTWRARLSNGRDLVGTGEHKIWTSDGWKQLELLTHCDTLTAWESTDRALPSYSEARGTDAIQRQSTPPWLVTSPHPTASSCIDRSGSRCADLSRQDTTSTTRTATTPTTESATSSLSTAGSTSVRTCESPGALESPPIASSDSPSPRPGPGTDRQRVSGGTPRTDVERWRQESRSACNASSADLHLNLSSHGQRCAAGSVSPSSGVIRDSTTSKGHALGAASCLCETSTRSRSAARLHAVSVAPTGCAEPVFDLSVDGDPEFFANGVLVHNSSDTLTYARRLIAHLFETGELGPKPAAKPLYADPMGLAEPEERGEFGELLQSGEDWSDLFT
jgi:hypothetical protein